MDEDDEDDENGHSYWHFEIPDLDGKILTNVSCKSVACFLLMLQRKGLILTLRCVVIFYFSGQCTPNPCLNNGVCKEKGRRKFKCDCPKPYKGKKCERGVKKKIPSLHSFVKLHIYIYAKCKKTN